MTRVIYKSIQIQCRRQICIYQITLERGQKESGVITTSRRRTLHVLKIPTLIFYGDFFPQIWDIISKQAYQGHTAELLNDKMFIDTPLSMQIGMTLKIYSYHDNTINQANSRLRRNGLVL